jgi:hypothetical protein
VKTASLWVPLTLAERSGRSSRRKACTKDWVTTFNRSDDVRGSGGRNTANTAGADAASGPNDAVALLPPCQPDAPTVAGRRLRLHSSSPAAASAVAEGSKAKLAPLFVGRGAVAPMHSMLLARVAQCQANCGASRSPPT